MGEQTDHGYLYKPAYGEYGPGCHSRFVAGFDLVDEDLYQVKSSQASLNSLVTLWALAEEMLVRVTGTAVYSDADTFTMAGDKTSYFTVGTKIQAASTTGNALKWTTVQSSSYAGGTTTVNLDAGILDAGLSHVFVVASRDGLTPHGAGYIVANDYGSPGQAAWDAAIAAIGVLERTLILGPGNWGAPSSNSPANITTQIMRGAMVDPVNDDITFLGPVEAGPYQWIDISGSGSISFSDNRVVFVDWWGPDGLDDDVEINYAIQAAPLAGTVQLIGTYTLGDTVHVNRPVFVKGMGFIGEDASPYGTKVDASGVTGTAIEVVYADTNTAFHGFWDFWLYGGNETGAGSATIGFDCQQLNARIAFIGMRVSGFTAAQDGTGTSKGINFGATALQTGGFSNYLERTYISGNDIGVYLGTKSQQTAFVHCHIVNNYTFGVDTLDTGAIGFVECQLEKNGKIADTTGSIRCKGVQGLTINGGYNEQRDTWPGYFMLCEGGTTNGYTENVTIQGGFRAIGNALATKGIILKTVKNFFNWGFITSFTTAGISYEPSNTTTAILNAHDYAPKFYGSSDGVPRGALQNTMRNPFFQKFWAAGVPVGWTNAARGTYTTDTDADAINAICLKMVGDGVIGQVSTSQTMNPTFLYPVVKAGGAQLWAYVKCPAANAVTSRIYVGGRGVAIAKSDSWQWVNAGMVPSTWTTISVQVRLCDSTDTAQATDALYVSYIGLFPGWARPETPIGDIDHCLYGSGTYDPDGSTQSGAITVTGAAVGDHVDVYPPYDTTTYLVSGSVTATNNVKIMCNGNLASGTWKVRVTPQ